jgi:hypothetical protein
MEQAQFRPRIVNQLDILQSRPIFSVVAAKHFVAWFREPGSMPRFLPPVVVVPFVSITFLLSWDRLHAEDGLRAGAAAVDISPDVFPISLRSGNSSHVHDPLHVRAVAMENGSGRAVIALIDDIGVGRDWSDEAKAAAAARTGWKPEDMLVCATHTHTAPKGGDTSPGRIAYERKRREGVTEAIVRAIGALRPAEVGFASDEEPSEVFNRRWFLKEGTMDPNPLGVLDQVRTNAPRQNLLRPAGPTDPELCVVDVRSRKGRRPLGLIANYALHYVGGIPTVTEPGGKVVGMASADYFGEFARIMPYRIGGSTPPADFVAMITNGSSGDINNIDFHGTRPPRAPFEQVRIVAAKAADTAWRAVRKIETYDPDPVVAMRQREVSLEHRRPSAADVERALRMLDLPARERDAIHDRATAVASTTVTYAGEDRPPAESVIVQAIRIGDQAIVSMPFEVLVEIGLEIKERSPFPHTFLIELANGSYGYLPPPRQIPLGGYETWLGVSRFEENASVKLTEALLEMLGELRAVES